MKTFFISNRIPVLFLIAIVLGLTTCKKDKEDEDKFFRVKSVNDYFNGIFNGGTQMIYDGERIWEMSSNDLDGDSSRIEYSYPEDNKAIESYYEFNGFSWNLSEKIEYAYQGDNISQVIYYSEPTRSIGALEPFMKLSLQYQDNNLIEELMSFYFAGAWLDLAKLTYTYSGDKLTQTMMYNDFDFNGSWEISYKEDVTYSGDNMDIVVESEYMAGSYVESYKYEFAYEGDNVKTVDVYYNDDDGNWVIEYKQSFTYDADGNLASASWIESGNTEKSDFIYEEKKGNVGQFIYSGGGAANQIMPAPTKSTLKYKEELQNLLQKIKD